MTHAASDSGSTRPPDEAELSATIYAGLRQLAARQLRHGPAASVQPTLLVHEAWLRIAKLDAVRGTERAQFFALAGKAMRSVLVDHARRRLAHKRGAGRRAVADVDLEQVAVAAVRGEHLLALDDAMQRLERVDAELVRIVDLMFFCGKTAVEVAEMLGVSSRTIERRWRFARAWLRDQLGEQLGDDFGERARDEATK